MGRLRHSGGGGAGPGKVLLALCPGTGALPASVPFILPVSGLAFFASLSVFPSLCMSPSCMSTFLCLALFPTYWLSIFLSLPLSLHLSPFLCCCCQPPMVALPLLCLSLLPLSPLPSVCPSRLVAGRMGEEAQGRCGLGSLPAAAGPPRICGFRLSPPLSGAAAAPYLLASGHETRIRAAWAKDARRQGQAGGWRGPGCWEVCAVGHL